MLIAPGATSNSIVIAYFDDSGLAVTGLVAATMPTTKYVRIGSAAVTISLSDLASVTAAYSSGGVFELGNGRYRLDLPDAAVVTACLEVDVSAEATGKHLILPDGAIQCVYPQTNLIQAASQPVSLDSNNVLNVSAKYWAGTAITATSIPVATAAGAAGGLLIAGSNAATTFNGLTTGALSATTITASGAVAFQSTFAVTTSTSLAALSCSTLTASGAVALQSTLAVTGTTTLAAVNTGAIGTGNVTITGTLSTSGTTTLNALTVTNATTLTGNVSMAAGLTITQSTLNAPAVSLTGNGTGQGFLSTGGATGSGGKFVSGATSGNGLDLVAATLGSGLNLLGAGNLQGLRIHGGDTGQGIYVSGGNTSGEGVFITTNSGDGLVILPTAGNAIKATADGTNKHGFLITGGTVGTCDALKLVAGTGGVGFRLDTLTSSGAITFNSLAVSTTTALTGAVTATNAGNDIRGVTVTAGTITSISGDVGGKVLGGGASTITAPGAWALDGSGNAIAPASTALSTANWTNARAGYLDNLNVGGAVASHADAVSLSTQIGSPQQVGTKYAVTLLASDVTGNVASDLQTIKTQAVATTGAGTVTFPAAATLASTTNLTAGTITNLTNLPSIPANWLTAAGIAANALNGKGDWLLASNYTAPDNTSISAIKAKTDQLTFTVANVLNVNIHYVNDVLVRGTGSPGNEWGP